MRGAKLTLCAAMAVIHAGHALGQSQVKPESKQPFEFIRSIQAIQDQMVLGNASAKEKLPKMMEVISERLLATDREAWRTTKNAQAAVIFTLSGGKSKVLRKALESGQSPDQDLELMRGALAYVEGRDADAKKILLPIDAKTLASGVGGHIAIIQSALVAKDDPSAAMGLLDQARILAPGTLVEEAALRRELVLAGELADFDKFAALSRQYIWRFSRSVYFDNFQQRFTTSIVKFCVASENAQFGRIEKLMGELDSREQLRLYLQIAQKAVINGKVGSAHFAAEKAVQLSNDGSMEKARAKLYEAATLILTDQFEVGQGELETIDSSLLPKADLELKEAIASLARLIRNGPDTTPAVSTSEQNDQAAFPPDELGGSASVSALIDFAQRKLGQTDELLERRQP